MATALWLALLTGLVEVVILGLVKAVRIGMLPGRLALGADLTWRHGYLWLSPHIVWMAPIAAVGLLLIPTVILALLVRARPRPTVVRVALSVLLFVCFVNTLVVYPRLHPLAVLLLSAGLAVQLGRAMLANWVGFRRLVLRSVGWLGGAVIVLAVGMNVWFAVGERVRIARLPEIASPNILMIILDTVRASNLSAYGYARQTTPNIDRLAREGVLFEQAIATAPWTLPSHVSAFTGRWPYEFTATWLTPYEGEYRTLPQELVRLGYLTTGFSANPVYVARESGLARGFIHFEDYPITPSEFLVSSALTRQLANHPVVRRLVGFYGIINFKNATKVTDEFLRWFDRRDGERPFFAFLNYFDAHEPYLPPAPFDTLFGPPFPRRNDLNSYQLRSAIRLGRSEMSPDEVQAELDAYDGALAYIDREVGRLLEVLRARGVLDDTIVLVTSDHGEQFGEHGLHVHGNSLFMPSLHVPMIMRLVDRLPPGTRVDAPVSIRDIPATMISVAGLDGAVAFPGTSLERFWRAPASTERPAAPALSQLIDVRGEPTWKSLVMGRYHYIWGEDRREELYDLASDPGENRNVIVAAAEEGVLTELRRAMLPHIRNDRALWERLPDH